ncbi:hypothetical protein [Kocuria rhizophila]|nr:hypothetical protein [Kocuria rhizophila]MDR7373788.1 hypothetical protein [Kocuria rhizophila]
MTHCMITVFHAQGPQAADAVYSSPNTAQRAAQASAPCGRRAELRALEG